MRGTLLPPDQVAAAIIDGRRLLLAGDERLLTWLPAGDWIGGSIPYFMSGNGAQRTNRSIYVEELPATTERIRMELYDANSIERIYEDAPRNGYTVVIIPAWSKTHLRFALDAPRFAGFATRPLIGWISGMDLGEVGRTSAKVFTGLDPRSRPDGAVAMHIDLPLYQYAEIGIVNIFTPGGSDSIVFPQDGFAAKQAVINGVPENFAGYLRRVGHDIRLPLIADYCGAKVNVSFREIDEANDKVSFYAPVFANVSYRLAKAVTDYSRVFRERLVELGPDDLCYNCILNYLYGRFDMQNTGNVSFPCTFGEVAYQLLNQTMVHLTIRDLERDD